MRVAQHVTIDAPESAVWELIREPSLYPRFLRDVTRWEPIAGPDGTRPRYRTEVRVGGVELGAVVEVTRSSAPHELRWDSVSGIEQSGLWCVQGDAESRCTAALELSYHAPAGVLGTIADAAALPLLHQGVHQSLARLKAEAEGREPARGRLARIRGGAGEAVRDATVLAQAGLLAPARPDRLVRAARQLSRWDATVAGGCAIAATLHPAECALVDERSTWTFAQLHRRTNGLARGLQEAGVQPGDRVAILCRNHAGFVEALLAASKLGADVALLNTGLAAPQLGEVLRRERPRVLIRDEEFAEGVNIRELRPLIAWHDGPPASAGTLDELIADGDDRDLPPPPRHGRVIILTSGTTGPPKAASRSESQNLRVPLTLLERIPLRARRVTHIASPLFHSWGYMHFGLAIAVSATLVLRRRFDPQDVLHLIERERVDSLVLVPTMLARMLELPPATRRRHDTSSLRVVAVSGSALQGDLALRFMHEFGDILYNLYGSTEVSWAAIATPADLRAAPGTVGRPPRGTRVAILDDLGCTVPAGSRGRIFVGNETAFEGYTDRDPKPVINGLVSTGDIGHVDDAGRLFVDGREDDMIVSGGENIFPSEVEHALALHPGVGEVAVIGVADERFGQRLKAYVVTANGAAVSEEELKRHVRTRLAAFKVPREIEFVTELPHTETGKVVKNRLGGSGR